MFRADIECLREYCNGPLKIRTPLVYSCLYWVTMFRGPLFPTPSSAVFFSFFALLLPSKSVNIYMETLGFKRRASYNAAEIAASIVGAFLIGAHLVQQFRSGH